jgi:hypothetical protein
MNKALHTLLSITDGGFYTPFRVPYLEKETIKFRKPGLNDLSEISQWASNADRRKRGQRFKTLGGLDWKAEFSQLSQDVKQAATKEEKEKILVTFAKKADVLAVEHIKEFWNNYGLELGFNIEHKETNTASRAAYWNKSHYALDTLEGKRVFKIRGAREYKEAELRKSPFFTLLGNILDGKDEFPDILEYDHRYLLKLGEYYRAQKSKGYVHLDGIMPGEEVTLSRFQAFKCLHLPFNTYAQFKKVNDRPTTAKKKGETVRIVHYEQHGDLGIARVHAKMLEDRIKLLNK